ncbi:MAG: glycoside hydrolase family 5 protein [Pseudonocardia sp.]|nr:glycoside hydrolase family 5 protein [Pseudonocardia sp.]
MRWLVVAVAVAVTVVLLPKAGTAVLGTASLGPAASEQTSAPPRITTDGDRILRGGRPWWFVGYNSFVWSGDCGDPEERMSAADVDAWFASLRHDGHAAVRLFFYRGWNLDRLDAAVTSARRNDVYLTITLDDAIGGCGASHKDEGWFADAAARAAYTDHLTTMLERYRGETAIAWFEYFNEPSDFGGRLRAFYDEMGALAERTDPDRLFASGTIAPYATGGAAGYLRINESPGVDLASLHEYDENEVESNHGPGARANSAGKPLVVGEFGIDATASGRGCPRDFAARAAAVREKVQTYTTTSGYAGAFAWAWQPGNGGTSCETGNLDADPQTQAVLRTVQAARG